MVKAVDTLLGDDGDDGVILLVAVDSLEWWVPGSVARDKG